MVPSQILTVYRKELLETVRDRRTLILMIAVPILLYPLIALIAVQVVTLIRSSLEEKELRVGINASELPFAERLRELAEDSPHGALRFLDVADREAEESVLAGEIEAAVLLPPEVEENLRREEPVTLKILFDSGDVDSHEAQRRLSRVLDQLRREVVTERLAGRQVNAAVIQPYDVEDADLATAERRGAFFLGGFISFLLITMALTGAFYPAVDLCAGERERGTLETLLVTPVGRTELVWGKYLTILTISLMTSLLNLGCMGLTFSHLFKGMAAPQIEFTVRAGTLVQMLVTLVPLAALFSAVTLGVSTFARSFKEAQNYLTPLFIIVLFPAMLPLFPGIQSHPALLSLPVAGPALLFRESLLEEVRVSDGLFVFASTFLYAALTLSWAQRLYHREDTLFRSEDRVRLRRPPQTAASPNAATAAVLFLMALAGSGYLSLTATEESGIVRSLVAPQVGFYIVLPFVAAWWLRFRWRVTFSLRGVSLRSALAIPLVFLGALPWIQLLAGWQAQWFPQHETHQEALEAFVARVVGDAGAYGSLVLLAVLPAVAEEVFCRGFLLSGFVRSGRRLPAVVASAVLFGLLHLDPVRLLTTTALGILFAALVLRSRSLLPAVVLHFLNNATVLSADFQYRELYPEALPASTFSKLEPLISLPSETLYQGLMLAAAAGLLGTGFLLLKPRSASPEDPRPERIPVPPPQEAVAKR